MEDVTRVVHFAASIEDGGQCVTSVIKEVSGRRAERPSTYHPKKGTGVEGMILVSGGFDLQDNGKQMRWKEQAVRVSKAHDRKELSGVPENDTVSLKRGRPVLLVGRRRSLTHHKVKAGSKDLANVRTR